MIPAPFSFVRAGSVDEALGALREHGDDAKILAGGHSLLPLMKLRLATPAVLVDVNDIRDQAEIRLDGDEVVVGGPARHCALVSSGVLREHVPLLSAVAERVGDPQVRHRGTLAGSLAHGDPASDLPAAVLALGGTITVRGPDRGWRWSTWPRPRSGPRRSRPRCDRARVPPTPPSSPMQRPSLRRTSTRPRKFRRHLARVLVRRALGDVAARERARANGRSSDR